MDDITWVDKILALPEKSLVEDLEKVLLDAICRYEHFSKKEWDENRMYFPIHAIFLLTKIQSKNSLPHIWNLLRQGSDLLHFWFGDMHYDVFFVPFYHLANDQPELLKTLILEPQIYTYSKTVISEVASQIILHQPKRREELVSWFREISRHYLDRQDEENYVDPSLLGSMVSNILDFRGFELLPELEALHKADLVDTMVCGKFDQVVEELKAPFLSNFQRRKVSEDINDHYAIYSNLKANKNEIIPPPVADIYPLEKSKKKPLQAPKYLSKNHSKTPNPAQITQSKSQKVGRNAPCPCGSGKKHKKCCWKNER